MRYFFTAIALFVSICAMAQPTFPYNGVRPKEVTSIAITHATVIVAPGEQIEDATIIVDKGKIVAVGKGLDIPANAVVYDATGKYVYPSFIELYSDYGMPKAAPAERSWRNQRAESSRKGAFGWNEAIRADQRAYMIFQPAEEGAQELRGLGFGAVVTHVNDGIARGSGALVNLGINANEALLTPEVGAFYSFNKGSSQQDYPSSLMGSIALLRQTYYDAQWYADQGKKVEQNISLEEFNRMQAMPSIFDAGDKWSVFRADKVGDEFRTQYIIRGTGSEYQRLDDVVATKATFILPLNFPQAYDVTDPILARWVELSELKHWELAPSNAAMLHAKGVKFAFTSSGLMDKKDFLKNIRKSVERGLDKNAALAALTTIPASMIKTERLIGQLKAGFEANFIVCSEEIFSEKCTIYENWVAGKRFEVNPLPKEEVKAGNYELTAGDIQLNVSVGMKDGGKNEVTRLRKSTKNPSSMDTLRYELEIRKDMDFLTLKFTPDSAGKSEGVLRFSGYKNSKGWSGTFENGQGKQIESNLVAKELKAENTPKKEEKKIETEQTFGKVIYPFTAYGYETKPQKKTVLIKNATLWTNEAEGKIENGQILISNGKIVALGKDLTISGYVIDEVIDAAGKHVTAGIIDEHSHIALASVNEGSQASSAEVQEASVLWPEDVDIYRQLSGGVTAAQLLHGSANPIGGQSALVKMKWGVSADEMLIPNTDGFIKFALGENVKQSNWGDFNTTRFPQTRMGVEQVYYDHFIRAREYAAEWNNYFVSGNKKKKFGSTPRRDLELDALAEILNKQRFITCHSYVQSEINMLMHVADSLGFKINTFTHILEGYKIADKMAAHGAGGSSFSDWWAYKMEVKDAIPYNGALMWKKGITVAFNSDDAEMARRLNQEAAKAVKYGGVPEEEALKFVTLNPAKLLHLDKRMGSLKVGKDADIVLWSGHPMSVYTKAEKTFVDGVCYFDIKEDEARREEMERERARIIQLMLMAKEKGEPTMMPGFKPRKHFHCDTMDNSSIGIFWRN